MTTPPTTLYERIRAELARRTAVANAAQPLNWSAFGVRTGTPSPNDTAWITFLLTHDPADALRRYAGELEVLERHPTRTMALAESAPSIAQPNLCWRCNVAYPCPEIRSLASRLGVSVDG